MQRRTIIIVAAITAAVLAVGGGVYWLSRPSYNDIADNCIAALKERPKDDKAKPEACDGLTEEDYSTIGP
ncbi:hypothetical protein [Streptomyces sp. SYP-A7185]|uniref:hypothetical protein n=1 Tax=Streptomyces sp. SYP-A7185 TaxID=3040076 RepID=UPI0038F64A60